MGQPQRTASMRDFASRMSCHHRDTDDDFFCIRYQVWYRSFDCGYRTLFETCDGCSACEQGRFNLKRHYSSLVQLARRQMP
ncbi:MAG: hypothetical protein GY716_11240 [bacterium]|nr:hypothetical protein [bacterium]